MTGSVNLPVQEWLNELQGGLKSLVVEGPDSLLRYLPSQIQRAWTSDSDHTFELFEATDYASLMDRLNALVAQKTTAVAGQPPPPGCPMALWLLTNAQNFNPEQLLLLGQILIHLPGLNLRMMLLHRGSPAPKAWMDATRGQTRTYRYEDLDQVEPEFTEMAEKPEGNRTNISREAPEPSRHRSPVSAQPRTDVKRWGLHALTGLVFLALGWWLGRWSAPQKVETEVFIQPTTSSSVPIAASIDPTTESASQLQAQTESAIEPVDDEVQRLVKRTFPAAQAAHAADQPTSAMPPASPVPAPEIQPGEMKRNVSDKTSESKALEPVRSDVQWLEGLSSEEFVIAHGSFRSMANALRFKREHDELAKAKIVPILLNGQTAYAVLTGPFKSQDRAQVNLQKLTWAADGKVMKAQRLQKSVDAALHRIE